MTLAHYAPHIALCATIATLAALCHQCGRQDAADGRTGRPRRRTEMIARLTWQPDNTHLPETVTVDMPANHVSELHGLLAAGAHFGDTVMWIPVRDDDGTYTRRLFRLARITAIEEPTR